MEITKQMPHTPNKYLREFGYRLSEARGGNPMDIFRTLRELESEIRSKDMEARTDLTLIEQSLPEKLEQLRRQKAELLSLRGDVINLRDAYLADASTITNTLQQKSPEVLHMMQQISEKQKKLRRLELSQLGESLIEKCKRLIGTEELHHIVPTLLEIRKVQNQTEEFADVVSSSLSPKFDDLMNSLKKFYKEHLQKQFERLRYPFEDSVDCRSLSREASDVVDILQVAHDVETSPSMSSGCNLTLLCQLMFDPLKKRFNFHFYGNKKTNDPAKPEWLFTQALSWMQTCLPFFTLVLTMLAAKLNVNINANSYFHRQISQMVVEKVKSLLDNETFMADPVLFAHLVDEAVEYEDSRQKLDCGEYGVNVFTVLTSKEVLRDWIQLENDTCISCVDDILASADRWKPRFRDLDDADSYKVCDCADSFVSLIHSLQMRTRHLPDISSQRQFLDLQVLVVDDFLKRLAQIASKAESPWMEPFPHIMNAVWYICHILEEWNEACALSGLISSGGGRAAFDSSILMYRNRWTLMADDIGLSIRILTVGAASHYQEQGWGSMDNSPMTQRDVSAFFCPFMMHIRSAFSNASKTVSKASLSSLFKRMVSDVSFVLRSKVLDCTSFNAEGANQMLYDINHGLLPVLASIFARSDMDHINAEYDKGMTHIIGSLKLLSLAWGNATLLREELENVSEEMAEEKLISMDIRGLSLEDSQRLFRQRTDLDLCGTTGFNLR